MISIGAIGGAYYVWQEAIKLPDEYIKATAEDKLDSQSLPLHENSTDDRYPNSATKFFSQSDRSRK